MKTTKILNCTFSTEELKEIGVRLALENQRKERLEDEKKQSQSQFKSEIDAADASIKSLAQKLARGSEDREVECDILYNTPEEGKKTTKRSDTGETIQIQDMTENELQDLFINNLGAQKTQNEFVFRDKSRVKMCSYADFKKIQKKGEFEKIGDGYSEEELVDAKPENIEFVIVVYDIDTETKKDMFEVYRFKAAAGDQPQTEPKLIAAEVIDAEPEAGK